MLASKSTSGVDGGLEKAQRAGVGGSDAADSRRFGEIVLSIEARTRRRGRRLFEDEEEEMNDGDPPPDGDNENLRALLPGAVALEGLRDHDLEVEAAAADEACVCVLPVSVAATASLR